MACRDRSYTIRGRYRPRKEGLPTGGSPVTTILPAQGVRNRADSRNALTRLRLRSSAATGGRLVHLKLDSHR
jgi:hypothetical protein